MEKNKLKRLLIPNYIIRELEISNIEIPGQVQHSSVGNG
jgi:hypothetical protein